MQAAHDALIDFIVYRELFAGVLWIGFEGSEDLAPLVFSKVLSRDDCHFFFFVELLVQLGVLLRDLTDEDKTLVFGKDLKEGKGGSTEWSGLLKSTVKLCNFFGTDSCVLSEHTEGLAVRVKSTQVLHVFEHVVEMAILGCSGEKNASIAPFNCIFLAWSFIVWSRLNLLDITDSEGLEKILS